MQTKPGIITTPFTKEQVESLKKWQTEGSFHPFTCCSQRDIPECQRRSHLNEGGLIPTENGWVCPCGKYTQNWAHDFMVK